MRFKNHVLSAFAIVTFFLVAVASKVNKIHGGAFSNEVTTEENHTGNYIVLIDGSVVRGNEIDRKNPLFAKDYLRMNDERYPIKEVLGYMEDGIYWRKYGKDFIKRLVHGKLNVYQESYLYTSTTTSANGTIRQTTTTRYRHYVERGENGPLTLIANQKDIQKAVADCPLAVEMASLSDRKMRRAIRANKRYLNEIFETYNNDCEAVR